MGFGTRAVRGAGRAVLAADKAIVSRDKRWGAKDMSTLEPVTLRGHGRPCRGCKGLREIESRGVRMKCSKCGGSGRR